MATCYMLIGVPTSGKSTWISNQVFDWSRTVIASTDRYVERIALEMNKTYNEVFSDVMHDAVVDMAKTVIDAVKNDFDIIWDQTSTTVLSRAKKFRMLPSSYDVIGVVFSTPSEVEIMRRNSIREGKVVPDDVINSMIAGYEEPTVDEGFTEIRYV